MKKYVKLLTVFLALVMILQAAPLSAMGDSAQEDTYTLSENEENTPETEPSEELPDEPSSFNVIQTIVWSSHDGDVVNTPLANGAVLSKNRVQIAVTPMENLSDVTVLVDGKEISAAYEESIITVDVEFLNGSHTLTVSAKNGKKALSDTLSFTVSGDSSYPTLSLDVPAGITLGSTETFSIGCDNMSEVDTVRVRLLMTKQLKVQNVNISEGVVGSYFWFGGTLEFDLRVADPDAIANGSLVTFDVYAPAKLDTKTEVYWTTETAEITLKENSSVGGSENFISTFDTPDVLAPVNVKYTVSGWTYSVTGGRYALMVKDSDGDPAVGVSVYETVNKKETLLGVTDSTGKVIVSFETNGMHDVYAIDDEDLTSAVYSVKAYEAVGNEDGTPYAIRYVGYVNNGKNITWMSNYNATIGSAQIRLSTNEDMSDSVLYRGVSNYALYETSLSINRVNEVSLKDLVPGTVYYYQVGDGSHWSETYSFEAKTYDNEMNVAIFGDMRDDHNGNMDLIVNALANGSVDYDFAIHAGALTDDVINYPTLCQPVDGLFDMGLDVIHAASTSEFKNSIYNRIFGTKEALQSYLYDNLYIAVINKVASEYDLNKLFSTMKTEIENSGCQWKILVLRDSVYSTNPELVSNIQSLIPQYAERADFDLVISGSDCNYSRTDTLRNGEFDETRGVVYLNCGSVSRKQAVVNSDGFVVTSDSYNALYVSLSATEDQLSITVYDVQPDGSTTEIDRYTKERHDCGDDNHMYRFILTSSNLVCDHCKHSRPLTGYVGLLGVGSYYLYYDNGNFLKGWRSNGNKVYFLDENTGIAFDGIQEINGYTYVFEDYVLVEGAWIEEDGARKLMWAGELLENTWHTQQGVTYYFLSDGTMAIGEVEISSENDLGETVVETFIFDENGALIGKKE